MSAAFKEKVKNIGHLNSTEKAQIEHCLIASLDKKHDKVADDAWLELAQQRSNGLDSDTVKGVSWGQIKVKIKT